MKVGSNNIIKIMFGTQQISSARLNNTNFLNVAPAAIVIDTFARADTTDSLGTAETGQVWQTLFGSTWGIQSAQAYRSNLGRNTDGAVVINAGKSDVAVSAIWTAIADKTGFVVRATDMDNYIMITQSAAYRQQGGFLQQIAGFPVAWNGVQLKVILKGSDIRLFMNGIQISQITDSFNQTATQHGLVSNNTTSRFANFKVEVV